MPFSELHVIDISAEVDVDLPIKEKYVNLLSNPFSYLLSYEENGKHVP